MARVVYIALAVVLWYSGGAWGDAAALVAAWALTLLAVLSWGVGLWCSRRLAVAVSGPRGPVVQGSSARFGLEVSNRGILPVGVLEVGIACRYRDGQCPAASLTAQGTSESRTALRTEVVVDAPHCGVLDVRAVSLTARDPLGLFAFRRLLTARAEAHVVPGGLDPWSPPTSWGLAEVEDALWEDAGVAGCTPPDILDLRPYEPGDPLHGVHWKLSARAGELITKVHVDDEHLGAVVLADLRSLGVHASPEALDRFYSSALRVSLGLARRGVAHVVLWQEGPTVGASRVAREHDAWSMVSSLVGAPLPAGDAPAPAYDARLLARSRAGALPLLSIEGEEGLRFGNALVSLARPHGLQETGPCPGRQGGGRL